MREIKIQRLKAENVANLPVIDIPANGSNIIVTGQNGVGKSTIRKAIMWVLTGNTSDGEKLVPYGGDKMPLVELELSDGATIKKISKEISQKKGGRITYATTCYLNGIPVTLKDLNAQFEKYVPSKCLPILLNPFEFFALDTDTRREMLTALFGNVTDAQVFASDAALSEFDKENYPKIKSEIRRLKDKSKIIPAQIAVLTSQIKDIPDVTETREALRELRQQKIKLDLKLANWKETAEALKDTQSKIQMLNIDINQKQMRVQKLKVAIALQNEHLDQLRTSYRVAQTTTTCPTCGQEMPVGAINSKIDKITVEGKEIKAKQDDLQSRLVFAEEELAAARAELEKLVVSATSEYDELGEVSRQKDALQNEISALERELATVDYQQAQNAEFQKKIDALSASEKEVGKEISACEKQVLLAEKFTLRQAELITGAINSHFQYVKFKMFDTSKSGEIKNACTATLNQIPFELLSKGEKFKAALDILQALQNYYGVKFPLITDDAESYTSNSLLETGNQRIILQVVDGHRLNIEIF